MNKRIVAGISIAVIAASALGYFLLTDKEEKEDKNPVVEEQQEPQKPVAPKNYVQPPVKSVPQVKKAHLYKDLPFSAIADLASLPESAQKTVTNLLKESGDKIYYLKRTDNKVLLVLGLTSDEEENPIKRHDFNFVEISLHDGKVLNHISADKESQYDKWNYDGDLPLSHAHYNDEKELVYTEVWNYSDDEPIKYKKTDKDDNVISLRKEVVDNGTNLREEHLFYDKEGNMTQNVSFNYDGIDLTRFTYYNSNTPEDSAMLVSDYEDGVKKKETLYSSDYKVKNVYLPEYTDEQISKLDVLDKDNKIVETLVNSQ